MTEQTKNIAREALKTFLIIRAKHKVAAANAMGALRDRIADAEEKFSAEAREVAYMSRSFLDGCWMLLRPQLRDDVLSSVGSVLGWQRALRLCTWLNLISAEELETLDLLSPLLELIRKGEIPLERKWENGRLTGTSLVP